MSANWRQNGHFGRNQAKQKLLKSGEKKTQALRPRRLSLENLEERALLAVTCGWEDGGIEMSAAYQAEEIPEDITPAVMIADVLIQKEETAQDVSLETVLPCAQTIYVSSYYTAGSTITSADLDSLINQAGSGGSVIFDEDLTVDFSAGFIDVSSDLTLAASEGRSVTFDANQTRSFFLVWSDTTLQMTGIAMTGGNGSYTGSVSYGQSITDGGAIYNMGTLKLNNCVIKDSSSSSDGGAIYSAGTLYLTDSVIENCQAAADGGAIAGCWGTIYLTGSQIRGCSSTRYGGGIAVYQNNVYAVSSVFVGNNGGYGGAIGNMNTGAEIYLLNSTMTGNAAENYGAVFSYGGNVGVYNSIAVLNYASGSALDIYAYLAGGSDGTLVIDYSVFTTARNNKGSYAGTHRITVSNVSTDIFVTAPVFANGTSSPMTNLAAVNLSLQNSCSALIDKGTNLSSIYSSLGLTPPTTDAAGNARVVGSAADIGAYENPQTRQRLGAPALSVSRVLYRQINLTWEAVSHAASYSVYYRVSGTGAYSLYQNTTAAALSVTSLSGNTSYDFYVIAKPSSSETEYADSLPSEVLTQSTSSTSETPWTPGAANYTVSVVGAELIVTWQDSGAEKIYLQYYYVNSEVDVYNAQGSVSSYTSAVQKFEVQNNADHTWSVTLIYGSKVFVKMWDSAMAETDVSYTSHNISISNVDTEIEVDGKTIDVFNLSSKSDSSKTIYLDFTGHLVVNSQWNTSYRKDVIYSPVFSFDDSTLYSQEELEAVYQIWLTVSEDYALFDVNVTTVFPGFNALYRSDSSDTVYGIRAAVGGDAALLDPAGGMGGIAYVGSFGSTSHSSKTIFVFPTNLSNNARSIAESASHETGHSLGLRHRGGGSYSSGEYSFGIVSSGGEFYKTNLSPYDWGPIMGASYRTDLSQWTDGSYYNAQNVSSTDDLTTMKTYLAVRDDDYSASLTRGNLGNGTYGVLKLGANGQIDASECEKGIGDNGVGFTYSGIIETQTDQDVFAINATSALESITLTVKGTSYQEENLSNLPLNVYLYAKGSSSPLASWNIVYQTSMPIDGVTLTYTGEIAKGATLYLVVDGAPVLLNNGGYSSDYGSLGYYEISGSYVKKESEPSAVHNISAAMNQTIYEAGDILTLQVYDVISNPTTTFGLSVSYDTSLLEFIAASSSCYSVDAVSGVYPGTKASQGIITAAWQNNTQWTAPDSGTPLLTLTFAVKKVTEQTQGTFQFSALDGYLRTEDVFNPPADPATFTVTDKIALKGITLSETSPVVRNLLIASLTQPTAKASYQWYRVKGDQEIKISGATSYRYKVTEADKGYALKVVAAGTKGYTGTVSAMTEEVPLSAAAFAAAKLNGTSIKVVWRTVAGADQYTLCYSQTADFAESENVTVSTASALLEGLTMGETYYFKVQSLDSTGNFAASKFSEVKSYKLNKLGTPVINSLYVNGDSITIKWNGQEGANRYAIAYSTDNFETSKTKIYEETGTQELSYTLTKSDLKMGETYSIRLQARDTTATKYQTSEYVYWKDIKLNRLADPAIDSLSANGTSVTLAFGAVPYANRYMIYYSSDNFATQKYKIFDSEQSGALTYTLSGLTAGNTYSFKIQARDKSAAYVSSRESEVKSVTLAEALITPDEEDDFFDFAEVTAENASLSEADWGIDFDDLWD